MNYNYDFFYVKNLDDKVLTIINDKKTYYSVIYDLFNNNISFEEFKYKLMSIFDINSKLYDTLVLKIFKYILNNYSSNFNNYNYNITDNDIFCFLCEYELSINNNKIINYNDDDSVNLLLYNIYIKVLNDKEQLIYYYYEYLKHIFDNLDLKLYPIKINIIDKNKIEIIEGTHRFIFAFIKNIIPYFEINVSQYKLFNDIMYILNQDYEELYKKNNNSFIIYNKIPHMFFFNFEVIREDRSNYIINFLNNFNVKNGLEIGPHNGLLSVQLAKSNYNMESIEYEKKYYCLSKYIIELCDVNNCKVLYDDITKCYTEIYNKKYDFIVSLSVFYHLKRNNSKLFESIFIELIKSTKILIFDDEINTNIFTFDDIKMYINKVKYSYINIEIIHKGIDSRSIYAIINSNYSL
jgi:hypothetical protein